MVWGSLISGAAWNRKHIRAKHWIGSKVNMESKTYQGQAISGKFYEQLHTWFAPINESTLLRWNNSMKQYGTENISGPGYFYNVHIQLHWLRTSSWNISEPNYFWKTHIHTWFTPLQCIDMDNQSAWNMEHTTRLFLEYLMYIVQCTITCTWFAPSWCINIVHIRAKLFLECSCFAPICTIAMHWYGSTLNSQHGTWRWRW